MKQIQFGMFYCDACKQSVGIQVTHTSRTCPLCKKEKLKPLQALSHD